MQDLLAAFQMLQKGATSFAVRRAINAANEQVQQINQSETEEAKRLTSLRAIAGDLTRNLAGIGADPTTIEQTANSIAPKPPTIQSAEQAYLVGSPTERARAKELIAAENAAKRGAAMGTALKDTRKALADEFDTFRDKVAKQDIEALSGADSLEGLVKEGIAGNTMAYEAAKTFFIKTMGDSRPSDADREALKGSPSAWAWMKRNWSRLGRGEVLEDDIMMMKDISKVLKHRSTKRIKDKAKSFAKGRRGLVDMEPDELSERLVEQTIGTSASAFTPQQAQGVGAGFSGSGSNPAAQDAPMRSFFRPNSK